MGQDASKGNLYSKILPLKKMRLVSLSDFHSNTFYKNYSVKTSIIPWGIAPESYPHLPKKSIDIIGLGSLISLKNYELFVDVIYVLNQKKLIKAILIG